MWAKYLHQDERPISNCLSPLSQNPANFADSNSWRRYSKQCKLLNKITAAYYKTCSIKFHSIFPVIGSTLVEIAPIKMSSRFCHFVLFSIHFELLIFCFITNYPSFTAGGSFKGIFTPTEVDSSSPLYNHMMTKRDYENYFPAYGVANMSEFAPRGIPIPRVRPKGKAFSPFWRNTDFDSAKSKSNLSRFSTTFKLLLNFVYVANSTDFHKFE